MPVDGLSPIGAGDNLPVMPAADHSLATQEAQMLLQLGAQGLILVGIGIKDLHRGRRTCHPSASFFCCSSCEWESLRSGSSIAYSCTPGKTGQQGRNSSFRA